MATVRKRGSSWQAQVRRQGSDPISKSFSTKAEAILWAREKERSIDRAELPANIRDLQRLTLADLLSRYEAEVTAKKRGAVRERYKLRVIRSHDLSSLTLAKLSPAAIARYRDDRLRNVQGSTVRRELAILQHCLEVARKEWSAPLSTNPVQSITLPVPGKARDRRLEEDDGQKLRGAIGSAHAWYLRPLIELAIETGMRRGNSCPCCGRTSVCRGGRHTSPSPRMVTPGQWPSPPGRLLCWVLYPEPMPGPFQSAATPSAWPGSVSGRRQGYRTSAFTISGMRPSAASSRWG